MRLGAIDYFDWPVESESLKPKLEAAYHAAQRAMTEVRDQRRARALLERLSKREHEVACGIVNGLSNKGIAADLGISPRTVEIHRANAMTKLAAGSVADAVKLALSAGVGGP